MSLGKDEEGKAKGLPFLGEWNATGPEGRARSLILWLLFASVFLWSFVRFCPLWHTTSGIDEIGAANVRLLPRDNTCPVYTPLFMCPAAAKENSKAEDVRILCASVAEKALGYARCPVFSLKAPPTIEDAPPLETPAALDSSPALWLLMGIALVVTSVLFKTQRDRRRGIDRHDDSPATPTAFGSPITSLRTGTRRRAGRDTDDTSEVLFSPVTLHPFCPLI